MSTVPEDTAPTEPESAGDGARRASDASRAGLVAAAVEGWQHELARVGGPNTLLWHRDLPTGTLDLTTSHPGGVAMLLAGRPTRLSDLVREPVALEEARRRVRGIRGKAVELWEEKGLATAFIAVGMATWDAPRAPRPPAAPVLLRTCTLRPTGATELDFDVDLGADAELNPVLLHYLRSEQGIELDGSELADRAMVRKGFDPHPVYAELSRACRAIPGFRISPRLVVGTFSHAKLPMVADLAAQGDSLREHEVIAALAGDPDAREAVATELPDWPADPEPADEFLAVDLDSAQQAAVEAARSGANLVVQGPPGTGKTQVVAGLVAALAADGKKVLFVAEKRAAIESVRQRLEAAGLGELLLTEPEGPDAARRLAADLGAAIEAPAAGVPALEGAEAEGRGSAGDGSADGAGSSSPDDVLVDRRRELVAHLASLHGRRQPWDVSTFDAQVALATSAAGATPPVSRIRVEASVLDGLTRERVAELGAQLTEAANLGAWSSTGGEDPWYASRFTTTKEAARALDITTRLGGGGLAAARTQAGELMDEAGLPAPTTVAGWDSTLRLMERVRDSLEVFRLEVFDAPLGELCAATATRSRRRAEAADLGVMARSRLGRQARALLRPGPPPADLHGELEQVLEQRDQWRVLAGSGARPEAPAGIEDARATFGPILSDLDWLGSRLEDTPTGNNLDELPLDELVRRLRALAASAKRLDVVPQVVSVLDEARGAGLGPFVDDLARRRVPADRVSAELEFVWWASLLTRIAAEDPGYGQHDGNRLRAVADEFVEADRAHVRATALRVRSRVAGRLGEAIDAHPEQVEVLRAEAARSRRHLGLRDLMLQAPDVLTAVRPCWAMSPLMVATLLPEGRWFDAVVIDEAGQVPTAHAVSAISRGTQVVVLGDAHQLPPAAFSTVVLEGPPAATGGPSSADSDEGSPASADEAAPGRSVLCALARLVPTRALNRHYRSQDERLIAFADRHVYDGDLLTLPGTMSGDCVLLQPVGEGADLGAGADALAQEAARQAVEHARSRPGETLGVIACDVDQAAAVDRALRRRLAQSPEVAGFFRHDRPERAFVKPIAHVQGDERDAVIVVLDGSALDERRAAVATTRARRRMTVLAPRDLLDGIDDSAARHDDGATGTGSGADLAPDFLRFAADSGSPGSAPADDRREPGHPVLEELASRLRAEGLVVHADHGRSAHRLDLAVEDPGREGRLLVAVETDGRARAAIASTRDRERITVEQLRRLGWVHVRVWTTDVFRDPARAVALVTSACWAASAASAPRPPAAAGTTDDEPAAAGEPS